MKRGVPFHVAGAFRIKEHATNQLLIYGADVRVRLGEDSGRRESMKVDCVPAYCNGPAPVASTPNSAHRFRRQSPSIMVFDRCLARHALAQERHLDG